MKIGIMLRHYNQHGGGVWVYTRNLLREMLALDTPHEFILLYRDRHLVGTYSDNGNRVREVAMRAPSFFLWDQLAVWWMEKKEKLDLIFNPKYSIPLMAKCRTVFVCHGLDWYVMPRGSKLIDRLNHNYFIPRYASKADAIITVSDTTRDHVIKYLEVDENRVHTVYHGVDEAFREPIPDGKLKEVRKTYQLPDRFFLYVGQIYPPKNFGRLLRAYARVGPKLGVSLVIAGEHRWLCEEELALIGRLGISPWIVWSDWIDRNTLPAFYALSEAILLPSLYESFGLPLLEAMSSGCPVVTANRYGTAELVGQAGMLVNPEDVDSIADGMHKVITDHELRQRLVAAGYERVRGFSWKKCAKETLQVLENVMSQPR